MLAIFEEVDIPRIYLKQKQTEITPKIEFHSSN